MKEKRTPTQPKPVEENADSPKDIMEYFFSVPTGKDTGNAFRLAKISKVLQNQGVSRSHLCQAMAIIIGIMSSRLGDPVPMIVTEDEGAGALEMLHACLNLVPENSWIEEPTGKLSKTDEKDFEGKTIICYEAEAAKDLLSRLLTETELRGKIVPTKRQSTLKKPTSFVAPTKNPRNFLLQNRYVTRIHVNADQESKTNRLASLMKKSDLDLHRQHKIESACIRTLLSRVKANPINIEFADKIIKKDAAKFQNAVPYIDAMLRILRNITRINNLPQIRPEELQAAFIGLDLEDLASVDAAKEKEPYKTTKIDYRYLCIVFGNAFKVNNEFLTPRQTAIFSAIFKQNIEHQQQFTHHKSSTDQQMLNAYREAGYNSGWATRENIEARLKDYGEEFSYSTLHNELQVLLGYNFIKEKKVPKYTNKFCYVATRPLGEGDIIETDLSKIEDPQLKESKVEIYNFLTNKNEKI